MAAGYWKTGMAEREAVFHLFFRKNPFGGGFSVAAGLAEAAAQMAEMRFQPDDLDYLRGLRGNDDSPLFDEDYIKTLGQWDFACDVDAVPEGTVVFPHEPLMRVRGPLWQAQLLETMLLNAINFQTLVATKAARVCLAAQGEPVLEFGMRRAQGSDGALAASRAAYIGGCTATSNVLAGKLFGIPVRGTHAHSWVMAFEDEPTAFAAYADALPNNVTFLVDTYDTMQGVRNAVEAGKRLREKGFRMTGVRLDSGDLAYLSIEARKILDEAGFQDTAIVATNDLDEHLIVSLKNQGARISIWGVGTKLVTAYDQPALGGVYKLSAIRSAPGAPWERRIKLSEQAIKISNPGIQQVRRFSESGRFVADMIFDCENDGEPERLIIDPADSTRRKRLSANAETEDLLQPVFRAGKVVGELPTVHDARQRAADQLAALPFGARRFTNPHSYPVGLEPRLHALRTKLILKARGERDDHENTQPPGAFSSPPQP